MQRFIEDFISGQEKSLYNPNATQSNIAASSRMLSQLAVTQQNFESAKNFILSQ